MTEPTFHLADVLDFCRDYDGEKFHACLCDCPYHYASIAKRFGGENAAPAQEGTDGAFRRLSGGFMGSQWDGVDQNGDGVAMKKETWEAIASVLHPGAFLFVFAGTLNDDMIALAMRQAGLIRHHSLFWLYGSGFPKSTRIPDKRFDGHRYGRQSLKPAAETILCFQVPYKGKPAECITKTGAGSLNIAGGRIGTENTQSCHNVTIGGNGIYQGGIGMQTGSEAGRWPSNILLDESSAAALDLQSGVSVSKQSQRGAVEIFKKENSWIGQSTVRGHNDSGGCSRYFHISDWQAEQIEAAECFIYQAKASRQEREAGLDSIEHVRYNKTERSTETWESTDQNQTTQAEPDIPHEKGITDSQSGTLQPSQPDLFSRTSGSGNEQTDLSPPGIRSTTETETNKTTDSKTSNLWTPLPTSDCIPDANSEKVSGGSLAESAESSNQSRQSAGTSTEKAILNTIGVGPVTSDESLRISVRERNESEKPVKEAGNGVRIYNSHPT